MQSCCGYSKNGYESNVDVCAWMKKVKKIGATDKPRGGRSPGGIVGGRGPPRADVPGGAPRSDS